MPTASATGRGDASAAFLPDGTLVVDQPDAAVLFWDVDAGRPHRAVDLEDAADAHRAPRRSPRTAHRSSGASPTAASTSGISATGRLVGDPAQPARHGRGLAASPTRRAIVAIGSSGGGISLYDLASRAGHRRPALRARLRHPRSGVQRRRPLPRLGRRRRPHRALGRQRCRRTDRPARRAGRAQRRLLGRRPARVGTQRLHHRL